MAFRIRDGDQLLDAHVELDGSDVRLFSRSGRRGAPDARNSDYAPGLRALLAQLAKASIQIEAAWVDSAGVQSMPLQARQILRPEDAGQAPAEQFTRLSQRMRRVGRDDDRPGGNNNKLIRLRTNAASPALRAALDLMPVDQDLRSIDRLPDAELRRVGPRHIWRAVEALRTGADTALFARSTDYDVVLEDGTRLPPKAVFGRAATEVLGFPVGPRHFSAGRGTVCFQALNQAGFPVVDRSDKGSAETSDDERGWAEGAPRLVRHLQRERARGLSQAKKDAFRADHDGRLFCEDCGLEPSLHYEDDLADACIEAHHTRTAVADMQDDHVTRLEDLRCLCANCHRLEHARLRTRASGGEGSAGV
ncbi:HNH endonuclease [Brevundimonas lutea]|uniref:HNH endonuclease n=1 Tax=Brevundimonas lutea TaxID=2293980 RepID=UPI000F01EA24|nr:hypothetical protein [Brevundimonas lutea]